MINSINSKTYRLKIPFYTNDKRGAPGSVGFEAGHIFDLIELSKEHAHIYSRRERMHVVIRRTDFDFLLEAQA